MQCKFQSLLKETSRAGISDLLTFIERETDFYSAPASTLYHGAYEGGLLAHSLAVYENLAKLDMLFGLDLNPDSVRICGLLHDICKINFYKRGYRNRKNDITGIWEKVDTFEVDDKFPLGHGEKSVIILQRFLSLSDEEVMAIRWHMGGFDDAVQGYGSSRTLSNAMLRSPLVTAIHMADLASCYFQRV